MHHYVLLAAYYRLFKLQWNPGITVTLGTDKMAVIVKSFNINIYYMKSNWTSKVPGISEWPLFRGDRSVGFHCTLK